MKMFEKRYKIVEREKFWQDFIKKPYAGVYYTLEIRFSSPQRKLKYKPTLIPHVNEFFSDVNDNLSEASYSYLYPDKDLQSTSFKRYKKIDAEKEIPFIYEIMKKNNFEISYFNARVCSLKSDWISIENNKIAAFELANKDRRYPKIKKDKRINIESYLEECPFIKEIKG